MAEEEEKNTKEKKKTLKEDPMGGKHLREALRKRELPRERDPRKEKTKGETTHSRRVVRN